MRRVTWAQLHGVGCGVLITLLLILGCLTCLGAIVGIVQGWAK